MSPPPSTPRDNGAVQTAAVIITIVVGGWAVVAAKPFLVPLVLAIFAFVLVRALNRFWRHLGVGRLRIPESMTSLASAVFLTVIGVGVAELVSENATGVQRATVEYGERWEELQRDFVAWLDDLVGDPAPTSAPAPTPAPDEVPVDDGPELMEILYERVNPTGLAANLASQVAAIVANLALVVIYLFFLLLERPFFDTKLRLMVKNQERQDEIRTILGHIDHDVSVYLGLKSVVSLMTAFPSYIVMLWVGLDFAEFWAILIFALNFIPNIGSLIATLLPSFIALVQFETLRPFWIVAVGVTTIQLIVANLIEPSLLGKRLNMSPLVVIIALVGWSLLWGVPGAFLCVPMTNIIILVLANIRSTQWIAVMLTRDGKLPEGVPT